MTDRQLVKFMLDKKRLPLSFDDYSNFLTLILPPMFCWVGVAAIQSYYKFHSSKAIFIFGLLIIVFGLLFTYLTIVRLRQNIVFSILKNGRHLDIYQVDALVKDNFKIENIKLDKKLNRILVQTKMTGFSWGEKITIILNDTEIYVNSRPSGSRQPFTIIKDVKNIKKLKELLDDDLCS